MKLIIGLGNPGKRYQHTRHNVGYRLVDVLQEKKLPKGVIVKKSGVFMNSSGVAVASLYTKYLPAQAGQILNTNLFVIHDDLDIKLGEYKIQLGKGPKDHKGLLSIYEKLGTGDFWHVRIGVDNRGPEDHVDGEIYVLQNFSKEELPIIRNVIKKAADELLEISK